LRAGELHHAANNVREANRSIGTGEACDGGGEQFAILIKLFVVINLVVVHLNNLNALTQVVAK
jgi:hypothetical protein